MDTINEENPAGSNLPEGSHAEQNAKGWLQNIISLVERLETAEEQAVDGPDETDAPRAEIEESPLSVMVRDGWRLVGVKSDGPVEYEILLTTGGPGLRIIGTLGPHDEPDDWPRLEWQDWGAPWTEYLPAREHREALQKFASVFYYGDN